MTNKKEDNYMDINEEDIEQYLEDEEFIEFINAEFDKAITEADVEELAEFVFGDMEEAIEAFLEAKNNK